MATMKAYQLTEWRKPGQFATVPVPEPGPGEILIKMKAVGLCHSDLDMMKPGSIGDAYASVLPSGFTLGHENAGLVHSLGAGVTDLKVGEAVVVHHIRHCGNCDYCLEGIENHCEFYKRGFVGTTRGLGEDGGLAEFMIAPRKEVVSIGDRDPVDYAALTDAGVTAYHALKSFLHRISPGKTAAVIGVGGLGAYGVQFLKLLSPARVFAIDRLEHCLLKATELGADEVIMSNDSSYNIIMEKTNGKGIDFIVDFVGSNQTLALATKLGRPQGRICVVGMEGGMVPVGWNLMGTSCEFALSMGSTRKSLQATCDLAGSGKLKVDIEKFKFDQIPEAYEKLKNGQLKARAIICME